ncbi:stomatin family protein [Zopfochytrium polystomum]|nr:stomatin family protein [Zopfochytrium polystomum]
MTLRNARPLLASAAAAAKARLAAAAFAPTATATHSRCLSALPSAYPSLPCAPEPAAAAAFAAAPTAATAVAPTPPLRSSLLQSHAAPLILRKAGGSRGVGGVATPARRLHATPASHNYGGSGSGGSGGWGTGPSGDGGWGFDSGRGLGAFGGVGGGRGGGGFKVSRNKSVANTVILFVPQASVYVVERFGKFHRILEPGLSFLIPFIDRIRHVQSLKEIAVEIPTQSAITQDNVTLEIDGVLYYRIEDPFKASYGVEDAEFAVSQLAQTTMRAEIGQLSLDRTLAERTQLNNNIVHAINSAAADWGIKCLRYEIRDIHPPDNVVAAMHQQVSAERRKRAEILESEGARQAAINVAEGKKQSVILDSEAVKMKQINSAEGESQAILLKATANAESIARIAATIAKQGDAGQDAISLAVAEKYMEAFSKIAKEGTTVVVPSNVADAASMVTQLMTVFNSVKTSRQTSLPSAAGSAATPVAPAASTVSSPQ